MLAFGTAHGVAVPPPELVCRKVSPSRKANWQLSHSSLSGTNPPPQTSERKMAQQLVLGPEHVSKYIADNTDNIIDQLTCPVCWMVKKRNVLVCKENGHSMCEDCSGRYNARNGCPTCRAQCPRPFILVHALNQIAVSLYASHAADPDREMPEDPVPPQANPPPPVPAPVVPPEEEEDDDDMQDVELQQALENAVQRADPPIPPGVAPAPPAGAVVEPHDGWRPIFDEADDMPNFIIEPMDNKERDRYSCQLRRLLLKLRSNRMNDQMDNYHRTLRKIRQKGRVFLARDGGRHYIPRRIDIELNFPEITREQWLAMGITQAGW